MNSDMPSQWVFGVGCLALEYKTPPARFSMGEWAGEVRKSLESIPSVQAVTVAVEDEAAVWETPQGPAEGSETSLGYTREFNPESPGASIEFEVTIPRRFHDDYALDLHGFDVGELFKVFIEYEYDAPVAFVMCADDSKDSPCMDGADAIVLVRKFLADALEKSDLNIKLSIVGPSPFHAQYHALPADIEEPCQWREVRREGYGHFEIRYSKNIFENSTNAWRWLRFKLANEFSVFYETTRRRNRRLDDSVVISGMTQALVDASKAKGLKAWFGRIFGTSRMARELGIVALEANLAADADKQWSNERVTQLGRETHVLGIADTDINDMAGENFSETAKAALAMVQFLEGGRTKEFEVAVIASSTVLGAAAGAAAALLAGA